MKFKVGDFVHHKYSGTAIWRIVGIISNSTTLELVKGSSNLRGKVYADVGNLYLARNETFKMILIELYGSL